MSLIEIFSILFIHGIADYVLQTDWEALNKSKNNQALVSHTLKYSTVWFILCHIFIQLGYLNPLFYLFAPITFVIHTITDYFTSRINSKLWAQNKRHHFFIALEIDQLLHYVQLFLTYYYLTKCWSD